MALFTNRNANPQNPAPAEGSADKGRANAGLVPSVEDLRRRARHRLIGAAVLVGAGVILFPLLFDAEPRTVSPSIPIVMDNKIDTVAAGAPAAKVDVHKSLAANEEIVGDDAPPSMGKPVTAAAAVAAAAGVATLKQAPAAEDPPAEDKAAQDRRKAEEQRTAAEKAAQDKKAAEKKAQDKKAAEKKAAEKKAAEKVAAQKAAQEAKAAQQRATEEKAAEQQADAEKQKALADQKAKEAEQHKLAQQNAREAEQRKLAEQKAREAKAKETEKAVTYDFPEKGRFVVQVGSHVEEARVAEVRRKLSAAGINNFTQKVKVDGKDATRVRMGPFGTRKEMERVAAKVKALGLPVSMYSY